jgi:hypothetical protein
MSRIGTGHCYPVALWLTRRYRSPRLIMGIDVKLRYWATAMVFGMAAHTSAMATVIFNGAIGVIDASVTVAGVPSSDPQAAGSPSLGTLNLQSDASDSYVEPSGNEASATASSKLVSIINSPNAGEILFQQKNEAHTTLIESTPALIESFATTGATFIFGFSVDAASSFALAYEVSAFGITSAFTPLAQVAYLQDALTSDFLFYTDELVDGSFGTTTASLAPGSYQLTISDFYLNSIEAFAGDSRSSSLSSRYSFAITSTSAVPEPATWAMMIGGFGIIGVALRSRRKASHWDRSSLPEAA